MSVVTGPDNQREEKISSLVCLYEKDLLRTCCVYLRDRDMAQDAVQETFLKAYKALGSFRSESTEKTWLYSIALNVCRDMRRSAWFRYVDRRVTLDHLPDPVEPVPDASIALMQEIMRLPRKLMEVHFTQTFIPLYIGFTRLVRQFLHQLFLLFIRIRIVHFLAFLYLEKRRLCSINIPLLNERCHITIEECQQKCPDMCPVHIGIGHDNDLVIPQLGLVKVSSYIAAECCYHILYLIRI